MWLVSVALFAVGLLVGVLSPSLKAQAVADPCAAPWVVVEGVERPSASSAQRGGWHAVKLNRCTGEALVFSRDNHSVSEKDAWYKLAVK
jgi:hypothetical protein